MISLSLVRMFFFVTVLLFFILLIDWLLSFIEMIYTNQIKLHGKGPMMFIATHVYVFSMFVSAVYDLC